MILNNTANSKGECYEKDADDLTLYSNCIR